MRSIQRKPSVFYGLIAAACCFVALFFGVLLSASYAQADTKLPKNGERLITIHDTGRDRGILTKATTLRQAFEEADIRIDENDLVEPGLDEKLVATNYEVNVYRARLVTIVDGPVQRSVVSPYRTAKQIVKQAGMTLRDEDIAQMGAPTDVVAQGTGIRLTITRATEFTFVLYGKKTTAYTQAKTVGDMLKEKGISLGEKDRLSLPQETAITAGMKVELWRDGKQTVTRDEKIPFEVEKIEDADHEVGYRKIKTPGVKGEKTVTYEIVMKNGKEVSRKKIQSVTTKKPEKQVEIVGTKPSGDGLTKGKGVMNYRDSNGIVHRETYYDLPMNVVMGACGGGTYTVRSDGAKVDKDGYILIAANLSRYPRCSIVETSLGRGKVYDTGGFAAVHPDGFDLATDWTNYDGR